jgi:hypothetical protein
MTIQILLGVCVVLSLATLLAIFFVLARMRGFAQPTDFDAKLNALSAAGERLERVLREEASRGREEASAGGKALREEVSKQILGLQDSVLKRMGEMQQCPVKDLHVKAAR